MCNTHYYSNTFAVVNSDWNCYLCYCSSRNWAFCLLWLFSKLAKLEPYLTLFPKRVHCLNRFPSSSRWTALWLWPCSLWTTRRDSPSTTDTLNTVDYKYVGPPLYLLSSCNLSLNFLKSIASRNLAGSRFCFGINLFWQCCLFSRANSRICWICSWIDWVPAVRGGRLCHTARPVCWMKGSSAAVLAPTWLPSPLWLCCCLRSLLRTAFSMSVNEKEIV